MDQDKFAPGLTFALLLAFAPCAQAPEICALYALDVPPSTLRAKFRTQFEKNKTVKDLAVLDLMLLKAQQEYQETMNSWKQIPHVMKWFAEEEVSCDAPTHLHGHNCRSEMATINGIDFVAVLVVNDTARPFRRLTGAPQRSHFHSFTNRDQHDPRASWKSSTPLETRDEDRSAPASKCFGSPHYTSVLSPSSLSDRNFNLYSLPTLWCHLECGIGRERADSMEEQQRISQEFSKPHRDTGQV